MTDKSENEPLKFIPWAIIVLLILMIAAIIGSRLYDHSQKVKYTDTGDGIYYTKVSTATLIKYRERIGLYNGKPLTCVYTIDNTVRSCDFIKYYKDIADE